MAKQRLTKEQRIKRRKRLRRKFTGFVFLMLAVIGVASIVIFIVGRVGVILDDSEEKAEYERLFTALVSLDPVTFSSLENADPAVLRLAAVTTALQLQNTALYERDNMGRTLLPTVDVDRYAVLLFGQSYRVTHETFGGGAGQILSGGVDYSAYIYMPENGAYSVPPTGLAGSFVPRVEKIEQSGNTRVLTIAYLAGSTAVSDALTDPNALRVSKYMEYVLIKEGGDFHLYSIRDSSYQPPATGAA